MADLKHLNMRRGAVKSQLTRFQQFLESPEADSATKIQVRLNKLHELWGKFESIQEEIEILSLGDAEQLTEAAAQGIEQERRAFEESYFQLDALAETKIAEFIQVPVPVQGQGQPAGDVREHRVASKLQVKLPTLSLPTFNGDYDKWLMFKDSFETLIHSNENLTPVQKFQYLRSSLQGEALQILHSLNTSAENYEIGWELLQKRYDNTKLIINTHVRQLLEFPAVNRDSHTALRQLVDHIRTHTYALQALGQPVDQWDTLLLHLVTNKLDFNTRREWEERTGREEQGDMPTMSELLTFLSERSRTFEMLDRGKPKSEPIRPNFPKKMEKRVALAATKPHACEYCTGQHFLYRCNDFLKLSVANRLNEVRNKRLCVNCLGTGHFWKDCSSATCRKCAKPHNTLLHMEREQSMRETSDNASTSGMQRTGGTNPAQNTREREKVNPAASGKENSTVVIHYVQKQTAQVILSTAQVYLYDIDGKPHKCRALLDAGSQSNLITGDLLRRLRLPSRAEHIPISGVNQTQTSIHRTTQVKLKAIHDKFSATMECLVLPRITERLPQVRVDLAPMNIPDDIQLADPTFNEPGDIDLLIGAGLFWSVLCVGQVKQMRGQPILQKTRLGWVVGGELMDTQVNQRAQRASKTTACHLVTNAALQQQMERFWRQEEVMETRLYSKQEEKDEQQFTETVRRDADGRFVVRLPIISEVSLGDSESQALKRLYSIQRRMKAQPELKQEYCRFIQEYIEMGHMSLRPIEPEAQEKEIYILPHQAVVRPDSKTTKVRVVFDASARTTSGNSLNDKLSPGPNLQSDLLELILRFRTHEYVITADIEKMFRQILVSKEDRDLQCILWQEDPTLPIQLYTLNTVTYGTNCAPFLAMRCLKQLAVEEGAEFPLATAALQRDFYMDDVLTGTDDVEEAITLQRQLSELLSRGQFKLRKWRTNENKILEHLSEEHKTDELLIVDQQEVVKTLGLLWDSRSDTLQFNVAIAPTPKTTKRIVLSKIAQVFDPLGLIGPVLINAKLMMQALWQEDLDWDESLPQELHTAWNRYYHSLPRINELRIKRNINPDNATQGIQLFGFGDASEKAYGACLYAVSTDRRGVTKAYLICSKSRVAPLKSLSLPRLELNAALLLSKILTCVRNSFGEKISSIFLWSDSTIVLEWIRTPPNQLKTFIANRVAKIQGLTEDATWSHVPSSENPADLLSRGTTVKNLLESELWWKGPRWITQSSGWPEQPELHSTNLPERKHNTTVLVAYTAPNFLKKFSSYNRLRRIVAYCHRFAANARCEKRGGPLSVKELELSDITIATMVQRESFQEELQDLQKHGTVRKRSNISMLNPYLDEKGMIRVGGRIRNAEVTVDQKHPIVLPARHHITRLIMEAEHKRLLHCGSEQLLHSIRLRYWPLSGRREARAVTHKCLDCFRRNPQVPETLMADLPKVRVTEVPRPFTVCGIDYAGPLQMRESKRRGRLPIAKAYIAVFTCFSTKAVHLELVSDLTTEAFLATLRRFTARRGLCKQIFSDNGTNFVGAARELRDIYEFLAKQENEITTTLANQQITWNFIPPRAPHFGGLWEAAVKATKRHLYTVTRDLILTFEEYYTLLTEIEAILNSRPLTPVSSDPKDLSVLTPSHFLIGGSLLQPVEHDYVNMPINRLSRWQHIQKVSQHFWRRWNNEYLHQLQSRGKWTQHGENIEIDTMVLIKEDNVPPLKWSIGRISRIFPGADGVVRVAEVRTSSGVATRPVKKLCPLPCGDEF